MEVIRSIYGYPDYMYNCSGRTYQEWVKRGEKWPTIGPFLMSIGIFYIVLYIPCIYAIIRLQLTKLSCYRIMLTLIFFDTANILNNSIWCGYYATVGGVFCMYPFWMYMNGMSSFFFWTAACFLYILLGVNRACAVTGFRGLNWFFEGFHGLLWVPLLIAYATCCAIVFTPLPFNSKHFGGIFLPFIEDDIMKEISLYYNPMLPVNNLLSSACLFVVYVFIMGYILFKKNFQLSLSEKMILVQAVLITLPAQVANCIYVYMQYFADGGILLSIVGHCAWQTSTGLSAIVYLTLNSQIRGYLFSKLNSVNPYATQEGSSQRKDLIVKSLERRGTGGDQSAENNESATPQPVPELNFTPVAPEAAA